MRVEWQEFKTFGIGCGVGLSACCFDPLEEILWTGNEEGRVESSLKEDSQVNRYSCFRCFNSMVLDIVSNDNGVYSVGENSLRHSSRGGLLRWTFTPEQSSHLMCASFSNHSSEMLVAGYPTKLFSVNPLRGTLVKQIDSDDDIVRFKRSKLILCGTATGKVVMRDPRTLHVEKTIQAHMCSISDMDMSGNYLATGGYSSSRNGVMIPDPLIKVFDIRTMKSLPPIPFPTGPRFMKFHPKLPTTLIICGSSGDFQMVDVLKPAGNTQFHQINTSGFCTTFDISNSGEALAFGDSLGMVHLWAANSNPNLNAYSRATEKAAVPFSSPSIHSLDENSPLSSVGMPYYESLLLSAWPSSLKFPAVNNKENIPKEVLSKVKTIDFVGYSPNPGTFKRNQCTPFRFKEGKEDGPKFRSEQDREKAFSKTPSKVNLTVENLFLDLPRVPTPALVEAFKCYRQVEIKYSKFGVEDFDFGYYNKTAFGGLETHIENSYCNAILQLLYFTTPFREICKRHIKMTCIKEYCLTCELGFLFRMLEDSKGMNCQATNFLRAFSHVPQASALGLFEQTDSSNKPSFSKLIQNLNRFIMEQVNQELSFQSLGKLQLVKNVKMFVDTEKNGTIPSEVQQIMGIAIESASQCTTCKQERLRFTCPFTIDLIYPKQHPHEKNIFPSLLAQSIEKKTSAKAWCVKCNKYMVTAQSRKVKCLPYQLSINANAFGDDLRVWHDDHAKCFLPNRLYISSVDGSISISDVESKNCIEESVVYELTAVLDEIKLENEVPHLVAHIKILEDDHRWYIFNDFLVEQIPLEEDICHYKKWRIPSVIQYRRVDLDKFIDLPKLQEIRSDMELSFKSSFLKRKDLKIRSKPLSKTEFPPRKGYICAIDAEFVLLVKEESEIRSDGSRSVLRPSRLSLARVSVLRGCGPDESIPFIDEYISTSDPIVDYLTEFSGINVGDLDKQISQHPLVSLKSSYKKLRYLIDLGCIFVGHGLKKDFRILNLLIPPMQVVDTVDIFFLRHKSRKLSLRFLSWFLLKKDIQQDSHDSIEDARTALELYKKYLEFKELGTFDQVLENIYEEGKLVNFKPPNAGSSMIQSSPELPYMHSPRKERLRQDKKMSSPGRTSHLKHK